MRACLFHVIALASLLSAVLDAPAAVRFVDANSTSPATPFLTWATAAQTIQDALDASSPDDEILVTNGVYATGGRVVYGTMTNRVAVTQLVTVRSVNGPQFTIIQGRQVPGTTNGDGAVRCVFLTNGAVLSGFTLTNGATRRRVYADEHGGGVWCQSTNALLTNCVLSGNSALGAGGGAIFGTLNNCILVGNSAGFGGGAVQATLSNCMLIANSAADYGGGAGDTAMNSCTLLSNLASFGGGAYSGTLNNCHLAFNRAGRDGGGAYLGTLNQCVLKMNRAAVNGGGAYSATLNNCTLLGNTANSEAGGVHSGTLNNCTLFGNSAFQGGGARDATLNNCIVYFNTASFEGNYHQDPSSPLVLNHCCTTPLPFFKGQGNFTNAPLFVDSSLGDLRLQSNSPCINAGLNAYAPAGQDLDGAARIVAGTVDVGAYEVQSPRSVISYAWLQQFRLPTDGSADLTDPDHDGLNNQQEWRCGTVPTNATSVLRLLGPQKVGSNLLVRWQSVPGRSYSLERSTNLAPPSSMRFFPLATNLSGQSGTTTYTDTNPAGTGPRFYRVGVP